MTFTMTGSTDMGLKSDGWTAAVLLGTGVTKRSKWDETPSTPIDLCTFSPFKAVKTSSSQIFWKRNTNVLQCSACSSL